MLSRIVILTAMVAAVITLYSCIRLGTKVQHTWSFMNFQRKEYGVLSRVILLTSLLDYNFLSRNSETFHSTVTVQCSKCQNEFHAAGNQRSLRNADVLNGAKGPAFDNIQLLSLCHYKSNGSSPHHWKAQHTRLLLFGSVNHVIQYFLGFLALNTSGLSVC